MSALHLGLVLPSPPSRPPGEDSRALDWRGRGAIVEGSPGKEERETHLLVPTVK